MSDGATEMMLEEREATQGSIMFFRSGGIKTFIHKDASPDDCITMAALLLTELRRILNERPS